MSLLEEAIHGSSATRPESDHSSGAPEADSAASGGVKLELVSEPALDAERIDFLRRQVAFHQQELRESPQRGESGMPWQQLDYHRRGAERGLAALSQYGAAAVEPLLRGEINPLDPRQTAE